jgi:hypothetical protein
MNEIGDQGRQAIILPLSPAKFDRYVAGLDVTSFTQASAKRADEVAEGVRRTAADESDRRLLRAGRQRPCRAPPSSR